MKTKLYKKIASLLTAIENCRKQSDKHGWIKHHKHAIKNLVKTYMPSGGGFADTTKLSFDESTPDKLVFGTQFHHMNDIGYYDGWTNHKVIVTPSLAFGFGFELDVTGEDRNEIKDYIADVFQESLMEEMEY